MKYLFMSGNRLLRCIAFLFIMFYFSIAFSDNQVVIYERGIKTKQKTIEWECSSSNPITVSTISDQPKKRVVESGLVNISVQDKQLLINGRQAGVCEVRLSVQQGVINVQDRTYLGTLHIECRDGLFRVTHEINTVQQDSEIGNAKKEKMYSVRVLLAETFHRDGVEWDIECPSGFIMRDMLNRKILDVVVDTRVLVNSAGDIIIANGKKYPSNHICFVPQKGHVSVNGQAYEGTFSVVIHKEQRLLINTVPLEDYVCSVLHSESWPGWPLEVNKAFAIASRSYVLAMILRVQETKSPYHIRNTNIHQTYKGVHNKEVLRTAVAQTRGIFLVHDNKPIIAMFDCCCGGVIPAKISNFDFSKAPYLARTYPCSYCKSCSLYQWKAEYSLPELSKIFDAPFSLSHTIKHMNVMKKDAAGLVVQVNVKGARHSRQVSGRNVYSLLKKVKSFYFSITKKDNVVIFEGRGFGHHLGLCQWGAREMIRVGKGYKDILAFYYPGTDFACLC